MLDFRLAILDWRTPYWASVAFIYRLHFQGKLVWFPDGVTTGSQVGQDEGTREIKLPQKSIMQFIHNPAISNCIKKQEQNIITF